MYFCITTDERKDRREMCEFLFEEFSPQKVHFISNPKHEIPAQGIFQAHLQVFKEILHHPDQSFHLIMEDDIFIDSLFFSQVERIRTKYLPQDSIDFIMLCPWNIFPQDVDSELVLTEHLSATAYLIRTSFAKTLYSDLHQLSLNRSLFMQKKYHFDLYLSTNYPIYSLKTPICYQRQSFSDNIWFSWFPWGNYLTQTCCWPTIQQSTLMGYCFYHCIHCFISPKTKYQQIPHQ